jgi:gamma-glutamyltranspeptidase/glutathione hydrolase
MVPLTRDRAKGVASPHYHSKKETEVKMRKVRSCLTVIVLTLACASPAIPDEPTRQAIIRYESVHHPEVALHGMVVSQNVLASQIGRDVLQRGGNAVDAAVAMGFALAVTLPRAGNLGGSGFMLVHMAESGTSVVLDYRSIAPLASNEQLFRKVDGEIDQDAMTHGAKAAAVPGTVAGLYQAWQRWGSMPWKDLLAPAKNLAADGIIVSHDLNFALSQGEQSMGHYPTSAAIYLRPDGQAWQPGEHLLQSDLAWSIGQIMEGGADAFYRGELAHRIVGAFQADAGLMTLEDLAGYRVKVRDVVATDYRGYRVVSTPPVSAGGITLIQMLNMLGQFDVRGLGAGSVAHLHLLAEVMKRAAANRRTWLGDPDFVDVPVDRYISADVAKAMAATIDPSQAADVKAIQPWPMVDKLSHDTTHYSVLDVKGNAVSNTYTLGHSFGNSWVAQGTGILFDNQMRNYSYRDAAEHPNALAPKKRMLSTMTPTIVLDADGRVFLVTGTPGGSYIINVILQILVNVIDFKMNIDEATHRPRMYQGWNWPQLGLEPGFSPDVIAALDAMGHETRIERTMGSVQSIMWRGGKFYGAADPRRPNAKALGLMYPPQPRLKAVSGGD